MQEVGAKVKGRGHSAVHGATKSLESSQKKANNIFQLKNIYDLIKH